jgi:DNA-binding transcriptional regulator YdaS (Cro superfamily)
MQNGSKGKDFKMASLLGSNYLPTEYQSFIHLSRYSRWLEDKGRRESWSETVGRLISFFKEHIDTNYKGVITNKEWDQIEEAILSLEVMPSMRALMTAGKALDREHIAGYNCSYIPIDSPRSFDEVLYILMNGTGVGFSVERQYADKLPTIPDQENGRRDADWDFGTNPCSEIILRPNQFCNLTEVVCRSTDTMDSLSHKIMIATLLGTIQSTFTNFGYLRKRWQNNTEEERLLGVSLTGIMDCPELNTYDGSTDLGERLQFLKECAVGTNKAFAKKLGIPQSTAITCVKPSGTVSQLVDSASGIHARHNPYYIRTVRGDIKEDEWVPVGAWCWENFEHLSGVSFLPFSDHTYQQAPYQDIDAKTYKKLAKAMPTNIDWDKLHEFEKEDNTKGSQQLACTAGVCELVDI